MSIALPLEPRTGLYLSPDQLEPNDANERARPGESAAERQKRVEMTARSIALNGQIQPVLVVELDSDIEFDEEGAPKKKYEYVDGGARVDALRLLNTPVEKVHRPDYVVGETVDLEVWCSVVDPSLDLFRLALSSNIHRTQNSILQMSEIISDVRDRNGWNGRGGQQKVCEYLGLQQSQVSGYEKISRAPKSVRDLIASGEVTTVDAALKLMNVKPDELPLVTKRAQELAQGEEKAEKPGKKAEKKKATPVSKEQLETIANKIADTFDAVLADVIAQDEAFDDGAAQNEIEQAPPAAPKTAKVTAKHVQQAAREVGTKTIALTRAELIASFDELRALPYPEAAKNFIEYFVDVHATGKGSDKEFEKWFDAMTGFNTPNISAQITMPIKYVSGKTDSTGRPAVKASAVKKVAAKKAAAKGKKK